jgi:hypothetical protein
MSLRKPSTQIALKISYAGILSTKIRQYEILS